MIKNIFKQLKKRRKQNFWMVFELFISFVLMYAVVTVVVKQYRNYKEELGFNYQNVWVLNAGIWGTGTSNETNLQNIDQLARLFTSMPEIKYFSNCSGNVPYSTGSSSTPLKYNEKSSGNAEVLKGGANYDKVMGINIINGRWFNESRQTGSKREIVINQKLKDLLFGDENPIGKIVNGLYVVVGVMDQFKKGGEFSSNGNVYFKQFKPDEIEETFVLKIKPGVHKMFEEQLMRQIRQVAPEWSWQISTLESYRSASFKRTWTPVLVLGGVCCFLVINVLLGLFGVLWYNIRTRRTEIGLRRSIGASGKVIYQQFIVEMLILLIMALIPGTIVAMQAPLMKMFEIQTGTYFISLIISATLLTVLVTLSALLPSAQAARLKPAVALREE